MVKSAYQRQLDNLAPAGRLDASRIRGVLAERQMRAARVVVLDKERSQQSSEMLLVHHDDVIEQLSPQRADHPLDERRLPG